ncbi:hypothetical protein MMC13_000739 [Lambiella insularis]|nr:hypothetical protein [Lambiella insularis]
MFKHRVLPLPPPLTTSAHPDAQAERRDRLLQNNNVLLQNSNMTAVDYRSPTDMIGNRRASLRSSSPRRNRVPTSPVQESEDASQDSALIVRLSARTTRKRTSSEESIEEVQRTERAVSPLPSASGLARSADSARQVCLCQPDPKIRRPRNAFILYRQHYQASVVAEHPGLANPEISKIIGNHWRDSSKETRNHWKLLAEEEKVRHQRQYPDYRYQPRRHGRNSVTNAAVSNSLESARCAKCGGRSMATPGMGTPSLNTPATPMTGYAGMLPPNTPFAASAGRMLRNGASPSMPQTANYQNRNVASGIANPVQHSLRRSSRDEADDLKSPDAKRRRFDNNSYPSLPTANGPNTPYPFQRRRESLPRPDFMPKSNFSMGAPPRSVHHIGTSHDTSLTLPPLKTNTTTEGSSQAKSVEAMIMSLSSINKIKVLAKISPPLASPGPTSPPHATRGAVIAVDGSNAEAVATIVAHLRALFSKDESHSLRVWDSPRLESSTTGEASLADYLGLISHWHAISAEVAKYITTAPSPRSPTPVSPKTKVPARPGHETAEAPGSASDPSDASTVRTPPAPYRPHPTALPIAILPSYQVTLTDAAGSTIPIADAYSPIDHWQWMATLWRGIVGPDITIVVRSSSSNYEGANTNGSSSPREEAARAGAGGVDVRLADARAILLRCEAGGKVGESALRRVGFEVGEYVRGMTAGER